MATELAIAPISWADGTKLTETYKVVSGVDIKADIVLPPGLKAGKHPLIIAWHGGALVAGSRDYAQWMSPWLPAWAASISAIIVSADHRLLPSASSADIREDIDSLWAWAHDSLPSVLAARAPEHTVDLDRVVVEGGSAGGFCSAHMALTHYDAIKAAILVYPMVDMFGRHWTHGPPAGKSVFGLPDDLTWRGEVLEEKIREARKEGVVTSRIGVEGEIGLATSMIQGGKIAECFGGRTLDSPLERVRGDKKAGLPARVWILHGVQDSAVPAEGSRKFADEVKKVGWKTELVYDEISEGVTEHGFDGTWTLDDEKLKKRLDWISEIL